MQIGLDKRLECVSIWFCGVFKGANRLWIRVVVTSPERFILTFKTPLTEVIVRPGILEK
jgi:hypothetical protein